jgi:hypothetical protein
MFDLSRCIDNLLRKQHIFRDHIGCLFGILLDDSKESLETDRLIIVIHKHGVKAIITILELDYMLGTGPHCVIILN